MFDIMFAGALAAALYYHFTQRYALDGEVDITVDGGPSDAVPTPLTKGRLMTLKRADIKRVDVVEREYSNEYVVTTTTGERLLMGSDPDSLALP